MSDYTSEARSRRGKCAVYEESGRRRSARSGKKPRLWSFEFEEKQLIENICRSENAGFQ